MNASTTPFLVIFDECGTYFNDGDADLKWKLRAIEGIPNATYQVVGKKVFVFDKLVELVKKQQELETSRPLSDLAHSLLPEATLTAVAAVTEWGLTPEPYKLAEHPTNGIMIRHEPFNAILPTYFKTKKAAEEVLANLFLESVPFDNGDFSYRGQSLSLCEPLNTNVLPPKPDIQITYPAEVNFFSSLSGLKFEAGFDPVPETLFNEVKALEASWKHDIARAEQYAQEHAGGIRNFVHMLNLEVLNDATDQVPDYGQDELPMLRMRFPELSALSDGSLYCWFSKGQIDCTANCDDDFIFFMIGNIAGLHYEQTDARDVGKWVSYALLRGDSPNRALQFGNEAYLYHKSITNLAYLIAKAIRFLATDKKTLSGYGPPVTTVTEAFRECRSISVKQDHVTQDISSFNAS
jgi:hypothetical protein